MLNVISVRDDDFIHWCQNNCCYSHFSAKSNTIDKKFNEFSIIYRHFFVQSSVSICEKPEIFNEFSIFRIFPNHLAFGWLWSCAKVTAYVLVCSIVCIVLFWNVTKPKWIDLMFLLILIGGAARCSFVFGVGKTWFVAEDKLLHTVMDVCFAL